MTAAPETVSQAPNQRPGSADTSEPKAGKRFSVTLKVISAAAAVVVAFFGGGGVYGAIDRSAPKDSPASLSVGTLSTRGQNPVDVLSASTAEVQVGGDVHGRLRDGENVFVLWRSLKSAASKDPTAGTVYSGLPCIVDGATFKCDPPTLGTRPESGESLVWVGIANSAATKQLVWSYSQQRVSQEGAGPQATPNGFDVQQTYTVQWPDF